MTGSTRRLPLPNSTFGRRWCLLNRALLRLTCAFILAWRCTELRLVRSVNRHRISSAGEDAILPLQVFQAQCECGLLHRAACPRSGRLKSRAQTPERTVARVPRSGATVRINAMLQDMYIAVSATIEVLVSGLPLHHGVFLVVDITIRCAHTMEPSCKPRVQRKRRSTPNSCTGIVAVWLWWALRRTMEQRDAVQHVLGLATAVDEDDRYFVLAGCRSLTRRREALQSLMEPRQILLICFVLSTFRKKQKENTMRGVLDFPIGIRFAIVDQLAFKFQGRELLFQRILWLTSKQQGSCCYVGQHAPTSGCA